MTKPTIAAAAIHLIAERGGPVPKTELVDVAESSIRATQVARMSVMVGLDRPEVHLHRSIQSAGPPRRLGTW